jgi:hypothetical protein
MNLTRLEPDGRLASIGGTPALAAELHSEIRRVFEVDGGTATLPEEDAVFHEVAAVIDECLNAGPLGN